MFCADSGGIVVRIEQIGRELASNYVYYCLDLETGGIVSEADCLEFDVGDGQSGVDQGKRFIRIPNWKSKFDELFRVEMEELAPLLDPNALNQMAEERLAKVVCRDCVYEKIVPEWLESLEPEFLIALRSFGGSLMVFNPKRKEWVLLDSISVEE